VPGAGGAAAGSNVVPLLVLIPVLGDNAGSALLLSRQLRNDVAVRVAVLATVPGLRCGPGRTRAGPR